MPDPNSTVQFRDVEGFPGYRVSSIGEVWSCRAGKAWHRLKPTPDGKGRPTVTLYPGRVTRHVQILVLIAFVGPKPPGKVACHFPDRDVMNNRVSNLLWGTSKENHAHRLVHGTDGRGDRNGMAIFTEEIVRKIREEYAAGLKSMTAIAGHYGVHKTTIQCIVRRKTWLHVD